MTEELREKVREAREVFDRQLVSSILMRVMDQNQQIIRFLTYCVTSPPGSASPDVEER